MSESLHPKTVETDVLAALKEIKQSREKLRELVDPLRIARAAGTVKLNGHSDGPDEAVQSLVNHLVHLQDQLSELIAGYPGHLRRRLRGSPDSVQRAEALGFRPLPGVDVPPWIDEERARRWGWYRPTSLSSTGGGYGVVSLLVNPQWETDWSGVDVAISAAKSLFAGFRDSRRDDLGPNDDDIREGLLDSISSSQPEWNCEGGGMTPERLERALAEGVLETPKVLDWIADYCLLDNDWTDPVHCKVVLRQMLRKRAIALEPGGEGRDAFGFFYVPGPSGIPGPCNWRSEGTVKGIAVPEAAATKPSPNVFRGEVDSAASAANGPVVRANPNATVEPVFNDEPEPKIRNVQKAMARAAASYEWVCKERPELVPSKPGCKYSRKQWEHIREHGCEAYRDPAADTQLLVPDFETWKRQVRGGLADPKEPKSSPRTGRGHGKSVIHHEQI